MSRHRTAALVLSIGGVAWLGLGLVTLAQGPTAQAPGAGAVANSSRAELTVLKALMSNPSTAPYRIVTSMRGGRVVLSGRVGTKQAHDAAVQLGIATGYPIQDDLVIDTVEAHRVAALASYPGFGAAGSLALPSLGAGTVPYVYPPPLFGRLDDPFFGFEPALVTYPPWYRAVAARTASLLAPANPGLVLGPEVLPLVGANGTTPIEVPVGPNPHDGVIEMTLDQWGVAVLRGTVPSFANRVAVGQQIAQTPSISEVINLLTIGHPAPAPFPPAPPAAPGPKPPPTPFPSAEGLPQQAAMAVDDGGLVQRVGQALARRPTLADQPIKVSARDSVVTLSGRVPTIYEAMLAFRAAQQTPGVRVVDDRLEFLVPDDERANPLCQKGRPQDIEPYLAAQLRLQVGDLAHVDQVRLLGETLEIRGTLLREDDRSRLEAILRSMPVLRGFRLEPTFVPE